MLALLPHCFAWPDSPGSPKVHVGTLCSVLEFLVVLRIVSLVWLGNKRHWHDRWMAYRLMAELVRQLRLLIPLGGGRPFSRPKPYHLNYGNPANSWMYWHFRAIDREVGLPSARVTPAYVKDCLGYVAKVVRNQVDFHQRNTEQSKRIEHRLHSAGLFLFAATGLIIAVHVFLQTLEPHEWVEYGLSFFCATLPAIGAALAGISNQGEFARISKRSSAMQEQLKHMSADLEKLLERETAVPSKDATRSTLRIAQTMVDEVLDWRVVFLDRPLVTPG
jgi:hypothetical protein